MRVLNTYASIVEDYSTRTLTFDSDTLNAFAGVLTMLLNTIDSKSVGGLIDSLLDHCLLWTHDTQSPGPEPRRKKRFPSFSWAGW
ncbi:hypothetical protein BS50DRAFT_498152, partial [Corynespora cassiicola Philippines]